MHEGTPSDHEAGDAAASAMTASAARRLAMVALGLGAFIGSTYIVPPLSPLQPWKAAEDYVPYWNIVGRELRGEGSVLAAQHEERERLREASLRAGAAIAEPTERPSAPAPPPARDAAKFPEYVPVAEDAEPVKFPIENAEALDHYFRRLTLVDLRVPKVVARAAHWGDSLLADDGVTFQIRTRLQARFGDAGHGFHVLGAANAFYLHRGVRYQLVGPWSKRCDVPWKRCEPDGHFGLAGSSVRGSGGGHVWFSTMPEGFGDKVSRFELWFQKAPGRGRFLVKVDDQAEQEIPTEAPAPSDDVAVFQVPDGPHKIAVRAGGPGEVRGYGVVLEREGPGIVWDNMAVIGAYTFSLHNNNAEHVQGQVQRRDLDLLVFSMGGNDAQRAFADLRENYEAEYLRTLRTYRAGKPKASCLIVSVTDHGETVSTGGIQSRHSIPILVGIQRKVALAEGCGFLDVYRAMGGFGAAVNWFNARPQLMSADLGHMTSTGHQLLASWIRGALTQGYADFRKRMAGERFEELEALSPEPRATQPSPAAPPAAAPPAAR